MALPSFCTEETALKLLKKARANRHDAVPRQILADWLEQYGGNDGRILSQVLRSSFGANTIQRLAPADTQRLSPFVGAIHGWFHGCQEDNHDPVVRAWLLAPDSFELNRGVWLEMMPVPAGTLYASERMACVTSLSAAVGARGFKLDAPLHGCISGGK